MGALELRQDAGGLRHFLDDEPVHAGDLVELRFSGGPGLPGRYEWSFDREERPGLVVSLETLEGGRVEPAFLRLRLIASASGEVAGTSLIDRQRLRIGRPPTKLHR